MSLAGKVVLVTGGAQGLGRAFSEELLKNGAKVCVCDVNSETGEVTARELQSTFGRDRLIFKQCDVTNYGSFDAAFKTALEKFGGIDIVVNNAGILAEGTDWRISIMVNYLGVVEGSKLADKYMSKLNGGKGGLVVNVSSIAGLKPVFFIPVYTGSKHAVVGFTRSLAANPEVYSSGMCYTCLCPTFTDTSILDEDLITKRSNKSVLSYSKQFMKERGVNTVASVVQGFMKLITGDNNNGDIMAIEPKDGARYVVASVVQGFMKLITGDNNNGDIMAIEPKDGARYVYGRKKHKL